MSWDQQSIQKAIQYEAKNYKILQTAFCHKSYTKEHEGFEHNEVLEFLGDAVLDLVVSDILIENFEGDQEGSLSRKRASVVNEDRLCEIGKKLSLNQFLLIGERESKSNLRENPRIIASAFEAVVGAIYKDSGYDRVSSWIRAHFEPLVSQAFNEHDFERDYKTRFQEWVQETYKKTPRYKVIDQQGPDHDRTFIMEVFIDGESWGVAEGNSKKSAAQNAAQQALEKINK